MNNKRKSIAHHNSSSDVIQLEITDSFIRAFQNRHDKNNNVGKRGLVLRFVGVLCSGASALLISYRANLDGKLSFYGIILKIVSFLIMFCIFVFDDRFDKNERCLFSVPKLFGIIMAGIQLYGIVVQSSNKNNIFLSI